MDTEKTTPTSLDQIPATRQTIDRLYTHGYLSYAGWQTALGLLFPNKQWGEWANRILVTVGSTLVLVGIVFFFAYNWVNLLDFLKIVGIQAGIVGCLFGAGFYGLKRLSGQLFLLAANVLVGVFLAVFGQIYQTGADAYQLFRGWAVLTLGWVLLSRFAASWALWLVVVNLAFGLYWAEVTTIVKEELFAFVGLGFINGLFLFLRELGVHYGWTWLQPYWIRIFLVLGVIGAASSPIIGSISAAFVHRATVLRWETGVGVLIHVLLWWVYRYVRPDFRVTVLVVLSICILSELSMIYSLLFLVNSFAINVFVTIVISTLLIFTTGTIYLKITYKKLKP